MLVLELWQKDETNSRFPIFLIKSSYMVPGEILSIVLHCIYQQKADTFDHEYSKATSGKDAK